MEDFVIMTVKNFINVENYQNWKYVKNFIHVENCQNWKYVKFFMFFGLFVFFLSPI